MKETSVGLLFVFFITANAAASGFAGSDNFMVFAKMPGRDGAQALATNVLRKAEEYRREIAQEWLGEALPAGVGSTVISVSLSEVEDHGLTWAKDHQDVKFHNIYLVTNRERVVGETLAHEIAHVVLATQFAHPNRLAAWVEEGIASRYDDQDRVAKRQRIVRWYRSSGNWPRLTELLDAQKISATDQQAYATAASLTSFLITKGGKAKFLRFAATSRQEHWSKAMSEFYGFDHPSQLQQAWQQWVDAQTKMASVATPRW